MNAREFTRQDGFRARDRSDDPKPEGSESVEFIYRKPCSCRPGARATKSKTTSCLIGTFLGFYNVAITGVLARNFATPFDVADGTWQPGDVPFPASFSQLATANAPPIDHGVTTYTELFYAGGSPQTCWDCPFAGGFLDPYGVMFTLGNGDVVDLFSFGDTFVPTGAKVYLHHGFEVIDPSNGGTLLDPEFGGVRAAVPEPGFPWLFGAAVLGLFAWRRSAETRRRALQHT